uniref:Uncharacterized protein n=1 Tax=Meloidogyne hapla TaxID=6305 RepID=A0A1I8C1M5_MELHA
MPPPLPNNFGNRPEAVVNARVFVPGQPPQNQAINQGHFLQQQYQPPPPPAFHQPFQPYGQPPQQPQQPQQPVFNGDEWMEHYLGGDAFVNFEDFHEPHAQQQQPPAQQQHQQQFHPFPPMPPPPAAIPLPPYQPPAQDIPLPPYPQPYPQQQQLGDNFIGRNLGGNNNVENAFQRFNNNNNGVPPLGAPNMPIHID